MPTVTRPDPLTIWKQQTTSLKAMVGVVLIGAAIAVIDIGLTLIVGITTGSWAYSKMLDSIGSIAFAWAFIGWVYWHGYAIQLEQQLTARITSIAVRKF
ncbi:hypothetical protein ABZ413_29650 [Nocardia rhamnosiphila]|uniref:hypothetical protein n=1 Tax=Nocardia rhamnosiphila TaxID=426716 RepID=UPI0033F5311D